jgi:hypothetical protein
MSHRNLGPLVIASAPQSCHLTTRSLLSVLLRKLIEKLYAFTPSLKMLQKVRDTVRDVDSQYVVHHLPRLFQSHTLHPTTLRDVFIFCHPLLTAPFTSNLDAPSGCLLGGMCSLLSPHSHWPVPSIFKVFPFFSCFPYDTLHGAPPDGTYDSSELIPPFVFGASALYIFLSEYPCLFFRISMWSMLSPFSSYQTSSDSQLSRLEVIGATFRFPPPSTSDDLRPLPPTAVAESQWGEPHSDAFGTGVRVAGSISL